MSSSKVSILKMGNSLRVIELAALLKGVEEISTVTTSGAESSSFFAAFT